MRQNGPTEPSTPVTKSTPFITSIHDDRVVVRDVPASMEVGLSALGLTRTTDGSLVVKVAHGSDLPRVLSSLRDAGISFAGGSSGWAPADVFAEYRDKGLVDGEFMELVFSGPNQAITRTR